MPTKYSDAQVVAAVEEYGSFVAAAAALGVDRPGLSRRYKRIQAGRTQEATGIGSAPDLPEPETLKGRSILRDPRTGEERLEWVKTDVKAEAQLAALKAAAEAMREQINPVDPIPAPVPNHNDLLNLFTLTDAHIGMLAWHEETDEDWDTEIAERVLIGWFSEAIRRAPDADRAVLAELGDLLHADALEALTPASKNVLDADSRYPKVVRLAIRIMRQIIAMLLEKYQQVDVIICEGNHDPSGAIWCREMLAALYDHEPRLDVDQSPKPFYCLEHGNTSLFFHHGHQVKMSELDRVMAAEFREVFGRTQYSYAHMGHLHHKAAKESQLMIVEQHRTLASRDAHAARHGYAAGTDASCITYHREHGEVGRVTVTRQMVN